MTSNVNGLDKLIIVKQLPVIEARLKEKAEDIKTRTEFACSMVCTAETLSTVKNMRAELNKEYKAYESARKSVKTAVMAPYVDFEATYKECIADAFTKADKQLGEVINNVAYHLREDKEKGIREYFYEHLDAAGLERENFAYERMGLSVTLSQSVSSLKKECKAWIEQRAKDMATIGGMENADEIMAEYLRCLELSRSILVVNDRQKNIAAVRAQREVREQTESERVSGYPKQEEAVKTALEAPEIAPVAESKEENELKLVFTVYGTKDKLKALKQFLIDGGYRYE